MITYKNSMAVEREYPELVAIKYIEHSDDGEVFDLDGARFEKPEPQPDELYILTDELYDALREVMDGKREAPFKIETVGESYVITPTNRRMGFPFALPQDPTRLEEVTSGWRADTEGRAYKLAIYDALFATPTSEE